MRLEPASTSATSWSSSAHSSRRPSSSPTARLPRSASSSSLHHAVVGWPDPGVRPLEAADSALSSSRRELMPSLVKTLRRCHSTVRADEQLGGDLRVGLAIGGEPGDVRLLRGELPARLDRALAHGLAGGQQLVPGPFGERLQRRSRPACRGRSAAARGRRCGGSRGAATRRRAGGRGRVRAAAGYGPAGRSPRGTGPRRPRPRSAARGSAPRCPGRSRCPPARVYSASRARALACQVRYPRCGRRPRSARAAPTWRCRA